MSSTAEMITALEDFHEERYQPQQKNYLLEGLPILEKGESVSMYVKLIKAFPSRLPLLDDILEHLDPKPQQDTPSVTTTLEIPLRSDPRASSEHSRITQRKMQGRVTLYELWWLECTDEGKPYRPMPDDYAERHPGLPKW